MYPRKTKRRIMTTEDDFVALYSAPEGGSDKKPSKPISGTIQLNETEDDEDLFRQLYGDSLPQEEEEAEKISEETTDVKTNIVLHPPQIPDILTMAEEEEAEKKQEEHDALPASKEEEEGDSEESSSSDEDDLMINLDENATDYEPSQSKFQKSFHPPGLGGVSSDAGSAIPGLGGATARVAIGGIPRSAIPGLAVSFAAAAQHQAAPRDPRKGDQQSVQPMSFRMEDAVFPSEWKPGLPLKLPGQTRVSPEEYKEFLSLGHGEIFSIDLDSVIDAPWRIPGTDPSDFFNYGMTVNDWKAYQDRVKRFRLEFTMKGQIQTFDQSQAADAWQLGLLPMEEDDGKDKSLQASMLDARDESYEAFVTSERPERVCWQRFGSPWDHTIVLTGHELDFGDGPNRPGGFNASMAKPQPGGGMRPHFSGPRQGFQQPPPPGRGGPPPPPGMSMRPPPPQFMGMQQRQTPKLGLGMDSDESRGGGRGRGRGQGRRGGRGGREYDHNGHEGSRDDRYARSVSPPRHSSGHGSRDRYSERDYRRDDRRRDDRRDYRRRRDREDRDRRDYDRRHRSRSPPRERRRR